MVPFFQVWPIKQIFALFPFSASAYYRANWINNAAIIVCVLYGCQSVVCMRVIKKNCVCVLVIFEREKLFCKSQIQPLCAPAEFCWHLKGTIWYCAQTKSYWKLIFWDINLNFGTHGFDFLAGLEFNMFHKIYILYKILFINYFHKLKPL